MRCPIPPVTNCLLCNSNKICIGEHSGALGQSANAVAIGAHSGQNNQHENAIAIGARAGECNQEENTIAIGYRSGVQNQGDCAISIGQKSGEYNQGISSIALGCRAGNTSQHDHTIIINAQGSNLNSDNINAFYVAPIRNSSVDLSTTLQYNAATKEVTYIARCDGGLNISGANYSDYIYWTGSTWAVDGSKVHIGANAGKTFQQSKSVAIGEYAGYNLQGITGASGISGNAVAIGTKAGYYSQISGSIAIGHEAGYTAQGVDDGLTAGNSHGVSVAIGLKAGHENQGSNTIAIGESSGYFSQGMGAIAIGGGAGSTGSTGQGAGSVAIGNLAGMSSQYLESVAIGLRAGEFNQGWANTGWTGSGAVAIGPFAGQRDQGSSAIAIGNNAGSHSQTQYGIAVGFYAGNDTQSGQSIAIGQYAGRYVQGDNSVAIGLNAGNTGQGPYSVAMGDQAGQRDQGSNSVAIGRNAGQTGLGESCIAIGYNAGSTYSNNIVLNASSNQLSGSTADAFYVNPIRGTTLGSPQPNVMYYNPTDHEICYDANKTFIIDHPKEEDKYLVHVCLEGPEVGVYYRGEGFIVDNSNVTTITLPDYVDALAHNFTVQLTPIYDPKCPQRMYQSSKVVNNQFQVYGPNGNFFWLVHGSREEIEVEPLKASVIVKGDGPYKYISK